jgi:CHRD domain
VPTRKSVFAQMDGPHERARGSATITLERVTGRVCFKLNWAGIGTPVAAHIHATAGGCAVVPLFVDTPKRRGCVKVPKWLVRKIAECPASYYVTVHTHSHPSGALRGQL